MGVLNFNKAFGITGQPIKKLGPIVKGKIVACDINPIICAAVKAMYQGTHLTDSNGIPTAGLNTLLSNILMLQRAGATVVGFCDNPNRNSFKSLEYKKRSNARVLSEEKVQETEGDEKKRHESNAWRLTSNVINDAQTLMTLMGIEYHVAPLNREAEQYAADMAKIGIVDIVMTNDTDAVMFGAPLVILSNADKKSKSSSPYTIFKIDKLLQDFKLDLPTFQKMCIALGTDFAPKTNGIGVKTVFTSGKNKNLSVDQEVALVYIQSVPSIPGIVVPGALNKDSLINWLSDIKGFNRDRIIKKLN
jgi:5'-3' exonuclease